METKRVELFNHSKYLMAHVQQLAGSVQNPLTPEQIELSALDEHHRDLINEIDEWVDNIKNYYAELEKDEEAIAEIKARQKAFQEMP